MRFGETRPLVDMFEHALAAFLIKRGDAVLLDIWLPREAKCFFDLQLDRQTMCVPTGAPIYAIPAHGLVARNRVFESACFEVVEYPASHSPSADLRRRQNRPWETSYQATSQRCAPSPRTRVSLPRASQLQISMVYRLIITLS